MHEPWFSARDRRLRFGVSLFVLLSVVLVAFGAPVAAQPPPDPGSTSRAGVTLKGHLAVILGHALADGRHRRAFLLIDNQGAATNLDIDAALLAPLGGPERADGKQVEVTGNATGTRVTVTAIRTTSKQNASTATSPAAPQATVLGARPFVTLLCRFADYPTTTPKEPSFFEGMLSSSAPGVDHFWREQSYDQINLSGSEVHGWYDLPQPRSYYFTADPPNFQRMADDCTAAADADVFFPGFTGINLVFNVNFGCCAWGGTLAITRDGATKLYGFTWMPPFGLIQSIWAHEMGHAFGLQHSANTVGTTYRNGWDVMSQDRYNCAAATDPTYGCLGQGTIAYNKDQLGWIPPANKLTASFVGAYSITLSALAAPPVTGQDLIATIPIPGGATFYTAEARYRIGYDSKLAGDAVIIHTVNPARLDPAWVVDSDGNGESNDEGAMWRVGETFTDATNGIAIAVTSQTANGFNITVTRTSGACLDDSQPTDYEPDNEAAAARLISVDSTERHSFCAVNDQDWVKFAALARGTYRIETLHMPSPTDTILELYGPDGSTLITSDDNSGTAPNSLITFTPQTSDTYFIKARQDGGILSNAYDLRITATPPPPPASLDTAGSAQIATVATSFATPLVVTVRDTSNNLVSDATVSFSVPGSGASATLSAASSTTDANGQALVTATAGQIAGSYDVIASVAGATDPITATFHLTNIPGPVAAVTASGQGQETLVTTAFAQPLLVTVCDAFNNPLPGTTVNFSVPGSGASATLNAASATTNASGQATITATAGSIVGSYDVIATVAGPGGPLTASFHLTNTAPPATVYRVYMPTLRR